MYLYGVRLLTLMLHYSVVRHIHDIGLQPMDFIHFCHVNLWSLAIHL